MKQSKIVLQVIFICLMLFATNTVQAQCTNITLSATSTPATCYNDGTITVTIGGSDLSNVQLFDAQLSLTATDGGQSIGFTNWEALLLVAPDSSVRIYRQAIKGNYIIHIRAFCKTAGDWITIATTTNVTVGGNYNPLVVNVSTARKSMSCKPTGEVKISLAGGRPPFTINVSAPSGYGGASTITINPQSDTIISLGNLCPAGTYNVTVTDACGYTVTPSHASQAIANDVVSGLYTQMERRSGSSDCRTVIPYTVSSLSDPDESYYWTNSGTYYEYCYLLNNTGTKNWQPLSDRMPTYALPANYSTYCSPTNNALWSYIRPIGCTTERSVNHSFSSYICGTGISVTEYEGSTCNTVKISASIPYYYGYCYPAQWKITLTSDTTTAIQSGTLTNNGTLLSSSMSVDYARGVSYTIIVTDADGSRRTTTFIFSTTLGGVISGVSNVVANTGNCYRMGYGYLYQSTPSTGTIAGFKIKYISGPISTLPTGLAMGDSVILPSTYSSRYYYFTSTVSTGSTNLQLVPYGSYVFEVTNTCGVVSLQTVNMSEYGLETPTYTTENTCGAGLKVFPSGRIAITSYQGSVSYQTTYYYIVSGPQGATFNPTRITAGSYLTLPFPGTYTIGITYTSTIGYCFVDTFQVEFPVQGLYLDRELTAAYACDNTSSMVRVQAINGVPPYTYTMSTDLTDVSTPVITPVSNQTGVFPNVGVINGKYIMNVKDSCNTSFDLPISILDLAHAHILYTSNSVTAYCDGATMELNCVALGEVQYEWKNPLGVVFSTDQRPRPLASHPSSGGKYTVTVIPEGCLTPITDTIEVGTLQGPPVWTLPNATIVLCQNSGNANIVDSSGVTPATFCSVKWYAADGVTSVSAPTSFSTSSTGTTIFYVSQVFTFTGCESPKRQVTVIVNPTGSCVCTNPATIAFNSNAPTSVCDTLPLQTTITMGGATFSYTLSLSANAGGSISPSGTNYANSTVTYTPVGSDIGKTITVRATTNNPGAPCAAVYDEWTFVIGSQPTSTPNANNAAICGTGTVTLTASGAGVGEGYRWYDSIVGGNLLSSSASYTPTITAGNTVTYYVAIVYTTNGCESTAGRRAVTATANAIPAAPTSTNITTPQAKCYGQTLADITVSGGITVKWYNVSVGGSSLPTTTPLAVTTYYAAAVSAAGCESTGSRFPVQITANTPPISTNSVGLCTPATVSSLLAELGISGKVYTSSSATTAMNPADAITSGTYYVAQIISGCESFVRTAVTVTVTTTVVPSLQINVTH